MNTLIYDKPFMLKVANYVGSNAMEIMTALVIISLLIALIAQIKLKMTFKELKWHWLFLLVVMSSCWLFNYAVYCSLH